MAAGGSYGWVRPRGLLHYQTAYCGESACSAVRDFPFCLKRGCFVAEQKSVGRDGLGLPEWKGSCYVSIAYFVSRKVQAYSNS